MARILQKLSLNLEENILLSKIKSYIFYCKQKFKLFYFQCLNGFVYLAHIGCSIRLVDTSYKICVHVMCVSTCYISHSGNMFHTLNFGEK